MFKSIFKKNKGRVFRKQVLLFGLRVFLSILLVFSWTFAGWPMLRLGSLQFPLEIKEALAAAPLIESADVTNSGSDTITTSPAVAYPAYESGDLLITFLFIDDDDIITPPSTGPGIEARTIIGNGDSGSNFGPAIAAMWWVGAATMSAGSQTWEISKAEGWVGKTIKVPAGEFDSGTPVDSVSSIGGSSSSSSNVPTPSWSTTNAGGRVVVGAAIDADPFTGVASGWTNVSSQDIGSVSGTITTRDAETTASESISSVNHTTTSDTSSTLGLVVNGPLGASPVYTQNKFEWFVPQASVTLTNAWPAGAGDDLAEDEVFTQLPRKNNPLASGDQIRIQMNFTVTVAAVSASSQAFELEYDAATDCSAASGWTSVGGLASGTIWRLYDETSIGPSTTQVNDISTSTAGEEGYFSETNPTSNNPNLISINDVSEWDWPVENNGATPNTTYCFRMVLSGGTPLDNYDSTSYPQLTTAPDTPDFMRHGNFYSDQGKQGFYWTK